MSNIENKAQKRKEAIFIIVAIGFASLAIRLLIKYDFHTSGLLYIGIPYLIAITILWFTKPMQKEATWLAGYWNYSRMGLIIMLGSSIVLFEGFICVLMFMPIYFGIMLFVFLTELLAKKIAGKNGRNYSHIFPIFILILSLEGTHDSLSFEREHYVSVTTITSQSIEDVKKNLIQPISFDAERPWFMQLFPQPYNIAAESLTPGDIHTIDYRYHRWFFTNTHEGSIKLLIDDVTDNSVQTKVLEDTSYMSNYMDLKGTQIKIEPLGNKKNQVTLTITFKRKLDPSWYFKPLEEYGVKQTADYLMRNIILKNASSKN